MKEIDYNIENIKTGVNKLAEAVLITMGPNGSTMIITDDFGRPYVSKDGVSVANEVHLKDPTQNAVATLVKQAAQQTVKEAGDGTTTSICLANSFINVGFNLIEKGNKFKDLKPELDNLLKDVNFYLDSNKKNLKESDIKNVAKISANNDEEIAEIITEAYKNSKNVKVIETSNLETTVEKIQGVNLNTPYFDSAFVNNPQKQSIEYSISMPVILVDGHLDRLENILPIVSKLQSVIIVADHFSKTALLTLKENYNKNKLDIALVKSPGMADHRRNIMKDLSKYFNIKLIDPTRKISIKDDPSDYIGNTDTFYSDKYKTIFYKEDVNINNYISDLQKLHKNEEEESSKKLIKQRIDNLSGSMSIIKVGGDSEVEIKEKKDRIDDAVLAVKCAFEDGIIQGGGKTLIEFVLNSEQPNKFIECLYEPYNIIFSDNKIQLENGEYYTGFNLDVDFYKEGIIDPVKVTKSALKNAISVAKIILSTKGVVLNPRLWS